MAITDKETGVWGLDQVYNKINQGSIWEYSGPLTDYSNLFLWGYNAGDLAQNDTVDRSSPVQVPGSWKQYSQASSSSGGIKTDNTLWTWGGNNHYGALGHNNRTQYSSPVQIPGTWGGINFGLYNSYAVNTDGEFWSWGYNNSGALGHSNLTKYSSPTQVPGTTWSGAIGHITGGYTFTGAIKTNGELWMWGENGNGQLGQNSLTDLNSPNQVPGTTWSYIKSNYDSTLALKTDGTLWTWGQNRDGSLGQNTADGVAVSSPVQVGSDTTWKSIAATFARNVAATKTDGTLWVWGGSHYGALGLSSPDNTKLSSPTQIPGTTWDIVRANSNKYLATKTDGTLWGWGRNTGGQLGDNTIITSSSPIQVPGTWNITNFNSGAYSGTFGAGFKL